MADLVVRGGKPLSGKITPSGNKNSILPILCASLLTDEKVIIKNVPDLTDVRLLIDSLSAVGAKINWDKEKCVLVINNTKFNYSAFKNGIPVGMRGSVLLLAPLLYRLKKLVFRNEIGGCALGIREIDPHLEMLKKLGAKIKNGGKLSLEIKDRFKGAEVWPDYTSVTTTENFLMGAAAAEGNSKITNAASEPHVQDLCRFLNKMGAKISGIGTNVLEIGGVKKLEGGEFKVNSDHHEVVTMLALGAMTGGEVEINDVHTDDYVNIINNFAKLGVKIAVGKNTLAVKKKQRLTMQKPFTKNLLQKIEAAPWPYFPADLLPLMIALAVVAEGQMLFWNKIYEGGFFWLPEMIKFGAHIVVCDPHRVIVFGKKPLRAAEVDAPEIIRATVALTMVALTIKGTSIIRNADTIKRAHPNFVEKMKSLGAEIEWKN
jgi:UDP-N-acetylglucosamine 1-carboxyvinyltransferase